jgi:excisionase family DNA binding protein
MLLQKLLTLVKFRMNNTLLTAKQAQELLKVDRTTIYRMLKDGRLNGVKVGHQWRFYTSEVKDLLAGAKRLSENEAAISVEVLPLQCMQPVQDVFAEIAEIGAVTADKEGKPLTRISNPCDFCKLILGSDEGHQACIASWRRLVEQKDAFPEFVSCHAGLQYARARIEVGGEMIAILVAGQFYIQEPDRDEEKSRVQNLAKQYHIEVDLISQAAQRISILDGRKVSQISGWLGEVARTFEQTSAERANLMHRLRQIAEMSVFEKSIS